MSANTKILVFDGHNDSIMSHYMPGAKTRPFLERSDKGHLDLPRAMEGGFAGGFFAIFPPPENLDIDFKGMSTDEMLKRMMVPLSLSHSEKYGHLGIKTLHDLAKESEGRFVIVKSINDIKLFFEKKAVAAVIHFEGAEPIAEDLSNLENFYQNGLRSVGLVWSRPNAFGYGVPFKFPASPDIGPGLTSAGKELVQACNRMGILIDVSHLNEKGFWDVEKTSAAPLVATHSCVHEICPMPRNLTDKQLDAIKNSQGLVGLNFAVEFIRDDGKRNRETPISKMVEHIRYVADRIGVEHIALGSDFDGAAIPNELKDVAGLPKLLTALSQNGFDADAINKIAHENWFRVLTQTWN